MAEVSATSVFRFTIRDLLWLMVVVALCSAWAVDRQRIASDTARQRDEVKLARYRIPCQP